MPIAFDPDKDDINIGKHGISMSEFRGFDARPVVKRDDRHNYGETRYRAWGLIGGEPYCVAYTIRDDTMRIISFRRAHGKELRRHGRSAAA